MMLPGRIFKGRSGMWVAEAPIVGVYTQGNTAKEADEMLADAVQEVVHRPGFAVQIVHLDGADVLIEPNEPKLLAAYVLKYQRESHGLSLADVAEKLGNSSRSVFADYEHARTEPTLTKFRELLAVVAPDITLTVAERSRKPTRPARRRTKPATTSRRRTKAA